MPVLLALLNYCIHLQPYMRNISIAFLMFLSLESANQSLVASRSDSYSQMFNVVFPFDLGMIQRLGLKKRMLKKN